MKIVYIAHPISGDIEANLKDLQRIAREINLTEPEIVPFVPYYLDIICMDDTVPLERERGIKNDLAILRSGMVNELRLYGDKISSGMEQEIEVAHEMGILVMPATMATAFSYFQKYPDQSDRFKKYINQMGAAWAIGVAIYDLIIKPMLDKHNGKKISEAEL